MYLGNTKMIVVKVSCTPFVYCCTCINFVSTDNTDFLKSLVELRLENVKKTFVTSVNLKSNYIDYTDKLTVLK